MSILQRHPYKVGAIVILSAAAALFLLDMLSRDHSKRVVIGYRVR